MATKRLRYCLKPGCSALVERGYCPAHVQRANADVRKLYSTARWLLLREQKRRENPLCVDCQAEGYITFWTDLDHEVPHRGDLSLFWNPANLAGRCHAHHSAKTGRGQ